jgi:hypothetical protein
MKTTFGLMPLAIGILLRHHYDRVLKDKIKANTETGHVPLRLEELIYDEAFTLTRVSLPSFYLSVSTPIDPTISGSVQQHFMDSATKFVPSLSLNPRSTKLCV